MGYNAVIPLFCLCAFDVSCVITHAIILMWLDQDVLMEAQNNMMTLSYTATCR